MANGYFNSSLTGQQIENLLTALRRGLGIYKGDGRGNISTVSLVTEVAAASTNEQISTAKATYEAISKKANSSDVYTKTETNKLITGATPTDYETVKSGAKKGETAVQPEDIYSKNQIDDKTSKASPEELIQYVVGDRT